jgi:hypothetical protein
VATSPRGALPPPLAVYQLAVGHYVSRALALAAKLGLADEIGDGACSSEALAAATETHAPSLRRVLRLLASVGVFEERLDGAFTNTKASALLRSEAPGSMRDAVLVFAGVSIQDSWKELEHCVRTGEPAFRLRGEKDPFAEMEADPEQAATFDRAMAAFTSQTSLAVAAAYDFSGFECVADIGGGNGALLVGILRANPGLRGIVFDQPHVVERARGHLEAEGLADRCEAVGGSFFDEIVGGADAYLLKHVVHDWNDEQAAEILRRVRAAMPPQAKLLVVEGVYPERITVDLPSRGAAANDVNMLVVAGGRQRTEAEFRELYASGGFRLTRMVPTLSPVVIVEGEPA